MLSKYWWMSVGSIFSTWKHLCFLHTSMSGTLLPNCPPVAICHTATIRSGIFYSICLLVVRKESSARKNDRSYSNKKPVGECKLERNGKHKEFWSIYIYFLKPQIKTKLDSLTYNCFETNKCQWRTLLDEQKWMSLGAGKLSIMLSKISLEDWGWNATLWFRLQLGVSRCTLYGSKVAVVIIH